MKSCKKCVMYERCSAIVKGLDTEAEECELFRSDRKGRKVATPALRPCLANGKHALFHRWADWAEIVEPSIMRGGHGGGVVRAAFAIVEYEDGTCGRVLPEKVRFIDNPNIDYNFTERGSAGNEKNAKD